MKKLLLFVCAVAGLYLGWRAIRSDATVDATDGGDAKLIFDRLWVDHVPQNDRDAFQIFAVVTEEPMGLFDVRSKWKGGWELFRYDTRGNGQLELSYPQSRQKEKAAYRATTCKERGFDFCLEISGTSRGARRYYSRKGWEIGATARTSPAALVDSVEHLASDIPAPADDAE